MDITAQVDEQFAGGTIGNTLHNHSILANDRSVWCNKPEYPVQAGTVPIAT